MKAFVSKVESLSDQSVKISLHLPKELFLEAAALIYKEVSVKEFEEADISKDTAIFIACQGIGKIKEMLIAELDINRVEPDNAERREGL